MTIWQHIKASFWILAGDKWYLSTVYEQDLLTARKCNAGNSSACIILVISIIHYTPFRYIHVRSFYNNISYIKVGVIEPHCWFSIARNFVSCLLVPYTVNKLWMPIKSCLTTISSRFIVCEKMRFCQKKKVYCIWKQLM